MERRDFLTRVVLCLVAPCTPAQATDTVGSLQVLSGTATWQASKTAPVRTLASGVRLDLRAGMRFGLPDKESTARVTLFSRTAILRGVLAWQTVPHLPVGGQRFPASQALHAANTTGGRLRGDDNTESAFYYPCPGGAVRASSFLIRWNPPPGNPATAKLFLRRTGADRGVLMEASGIALAAGMLPDSVAQQIAAALRESGVTDAVRLSLVPEVAPRPVPGTNRALSTTFTVLPASQETVVAGELDRCATGDLVLQAIRRARIFEKHHLLGDAATAHTEALAHKPNAPGLLTAAWNARRHIGDRAAADELALRLLLTEP